MIKPYLFVASSPVSGRGVFTKQDIAPGTIIESSPVLVFTPKERKGVEETKLGNYIFEWGNSKKMGGLALGYVSLYNHNYSSNCSYEMDFDTNIITIKTVKRIKKGEELFINYNADPNNKNKVWFDLE
jgi:SET domain-containing protein